MNKILSVLSKVFFYKLALPSSFVLIIVLASAYGAYRVIVTSPETFGLIKGPSIIKKEEKALVNEISKTLTLPSDEDPTVATVTEPEKLNDQSFFRDAQKDDRVIIYQKSKKVILYRPSEKRVIEVGVVNIREQGGNIEVLENYKFAILDSTGNENAASSIEDKLKETLPTAEIVSKEEAKLSYNESILIDVKGDKGEFAQKLAAQLGIKVGSLPDTETKVEGADFILIIGSGKSS